MRRPGVQIPPRPPHSKGAYTIFGNRVFVVLAMFGEPSDCSGALYVTSASLAARSSPRIYRGGTPARLRKVVELVHAEMDGDLSLEKLANAAGLSITHFSQMFRQSTGQSPHQFVLHRRLELAKRCCVPPRIASWMWRWRAGSRGRSTLRTSSVVCAVPVLQNIGGNLRTSCYYRPR